MEYQTVIEYDPTPVPKPDAKGARRAASFCAFAAVSAILLAYALILLFSFLMRDVALSDRASADLTLIANTVAIDLVAMPLAWLVFLRRVPKNDIAEDTVRSPLSPRVFFFYFPCAYMLMFAGALLGRLIGFLFGKGLSDVVGGTIEAVDVWVTLLCAGIVAPIAEELFFRKAMIDRLKGFHPTDAILYSALLFGLIHGNLTQFLYAFPLGVLLGFVYYRTRNIGHTILLHMGINILGGVVPQLISMIPDSEDLSVQILSKGAQLAQSGLIIVLCVFGIIHLVRYRKQYFPIRTELPRFRRPFYINAGFIVACVVFTVLFVLAEVAI